MNGMKEKLRYPLYTMLHPVNAYDGIKWEKRGSFAVSVIIILLLFLQNVISRQATGFIFNINDIENISVISIFMVTVSTFVLWFLSNWAVSSFMDGEGSPIQIWVGSAYALLPYIIIQLCIVVITNFVSAELFPFIQIFAYIGILWSAFLMFHAVYTIHQYSISQTILNMLLTILGMAIILFIGVLVYSLLLQIYIFVYTLFSEIMFRV